MYVGINAVRHNMKEREKDKKDEQNTLSKIDKHVPTPSSKSKNQEKIKVTDIWHTAPKILVQLPIGPSVT